MIKMDFGACKVYVRSLALRTCSLETVEELVQLKLIHFRNVSHLLLFAVCFVLISLAFNSSSYSLSLTYVAVEFIKYKIPAVCQRQVAITMTSSRVNIVCVHVHSTQHTHRVNKTRCLHCTTRKSIRTSAPHSRMLIFSSLRQFMRRKFVSSFIIKIHAAAAMNATCHTTIRVFV